MPDNEPPPGATPGEEDEESPLMPYDPWKKRIPGDIGGFTPSAYTPGDAATSPPGAQPPPPGAPPPPASQSTSHVGPPAATPLAGPQMSPDGRFWWNGVQWVPVHQGGAGGNAAKVVLIGCGAVLVVILLAVIGLAIVADRAAKNVQNVYVNSLNQIDNNFANDFNNAFGNDFANQFNNIENGSN